MKSKLTPIYAVQTITSFAGSIVGIFIPIYLLTLGYSVAYVMAFFLLTDVIKFVFMLATGYLSARIPLKILMLSRVPILIAFLSLLISAKYQPLSIGFLALLAVLQAAHFALYYMPLHVFFAVATDKDKVGRQVGAFIALPQLFGIGAPLLSGFVASTLGFNWVFGVSALLSAASAIPMANIPPYQASLNFNFAKFRSLFSRYHRYFWLEIVENIQEELDSVIWPLTVYLLVKNTLQVGLAGTLIAAGSAVFTYVVGRHTDRTDKFRLLRLGAAAMLVLWLWRLGTITPLTAFVISALAGFAGMLIAVPFNSIIYTLAREENTREFIMFREFPVVIARIIVYSTGIILATNISKLFWLAIAAYAIFIVMPRFKIKETQLGSS